MPSLYPAINRSISKELEARKRNNEYAKSGRLGPFVSVVRLRFRRCKTGQIAAQTGEDKIRGNMADIYPAIRSGAIDCGEAAPGKFSVLGAVPDRIGAVPLRRRVGDDSSIVK
jgi:hypothetical protein